MSAPLVAPTGWLRTVWALLRAVRRRSEGRRVRQRALMTNKRGSPAFATGLLGLVIAILGGLAFNGAAAYMLSGAVESGGRVSMARFGVATPDLGATLASLTLLVWLLGLVFVGEGLEIDATRRRHPMWEWLFSHPVRPSAVFAAEMLAPLAANPHYWVAPLVPWFVYADAYGKPAGFLAALLIGVPLAITASALGKAIEVAALLRAASRSRGAVIGLMSWCGSAAVVAIILTALTLKTTGPMVAHWLDAVPLPPGGLPWMGWFVGKWGGSPSALRGIGGCVAVCAVLTAAAVASTVWSTARGLAAPVGAQDTRPGRQARFRGRQALFRKELAWFVRDRSALIQVVLVPGSLAALQLVNLHGLLAQAATGWQFLCAGGIIFGTYFLTVIGPKSLTSEGATLWLAMTWPNGIEALLRAKARLWALLASVPALGTMVYAAIAFPGNAWNVALVALGWCVFAWSMALKAVTLARVAAESGEVEPIPAGRRWAVQLGTLSFAIGVATREIGPAVAGIVFSVITAAAMWQDLRARLPYLLDRWSERLPPPPTLMHAMVAISVMIELGAVLHGFLDAVFGRSPRTFAASYAAAALLTSIGTTYFLRRREVQLATVWRWGEARRGSIVLAIGAGLLLGGLALAYLDVLAHWPPTADLLRQARHTASSANLSILAIAVLFAPVAEEFLFRGLVFRAVARDWPLWQAVAVSAAFFASYHPVIAWLPVALVGAACALVFHRSGRLVDAVALHATYNAVVVGWQTLG